MVQSSQQPSVLSEVHDWARRNAPPLCTFVPDRLRNADDDTINQTLYQTLARQLLRNQTVGQVDISNIVVLMRRKVAIATWDAPDRLPGAGIIIYPAQYKKAILAGAIFLTEPFPEFIASVPPSMHLPIHDSPVDQPQYQHHLDFSPSFAMTSQHHYLHHSASFPTTSGSTEQSSLEYPRNRVYATDQLGEDPHRHGSYVIPSIPSVPYAYSAAISGIHPWSSAKVEDHDDLDLSQFSSGLAGGHGRSQFPQ